MKYNFKILLLCFSLIISNHLFAQNNLELTYSQLTTQLSNKISELDSLKQVLESKVNIISAEKLKSTIDNNKITELLSKTASVTNAIDRVQHEIDFITINIDETKNKLYMLYTHNIDSLRNTATTGKTKNVEIIKLTEKRLLVSPKINILSFSPQNVLELESPKDSVEEIIFTEYLNEAFNEVENKLRETEKLKLEIVNIIELNEETKEFLEDIDFDNNFAVYSNSQTSLENSKVFNSAEQRFMDEDISTLNTLNTQAKSFSDLLYQFGLSNSFNINNYFNSDDNMVRNNLFEFNNLIEMVEKQLLDYKTVINSKLQTTRNKK